MKLQKDMNMLKDLFLISTQVLIYYDTRKVKLLIPFIQWWVKKEFSEFIGEGSDKQWKNEQKVRYINIAVEISCVEHVCSFGQICIKLVIKVLNGIMSCMI